MPKMQYFWAKIDIALKFKYDTIIAGKASGAQSDVQPSKRNRKKI